MRRASAGVGQAAQGDIAMVGAFENAAGDVTAIFVLLGSGREQQAGPFERDLHIGACPGIESVGNHDHL